jgi:hypothetical protein
MPDGPPNNWQPAVANNDRITKLAATRSQRDTRSISGPLHPRIRVHPAGEACCGHPRSLHCSPSTGIRGIFRDYPSIFIQRGRAEQVPEVQCLQVNRTRGRFAKLLNFATLWEDYRGGKGRKSCGQQCQMKPERARVYCELRCLVDTAARGEHQPSRDEQNRGLGLSPPSPPVPHLRSVQISSHQR